MSEDYEPQPVPMLATQQTSKLAIMAVAATGLCLPGISGLLGMILGILALRQISITTTLTGSNLAWMAILTGGVEVMGWGAALNHQVELRESVDAPTQAFFQTWLTAKGKEVGSAEASPSLRTLLERNDGVGLRTDIVEALGEFQRVGERKDFDYHVVWKLPPSERFSGTYPLEFKSGAPCMATVEWAKEKGQWKVSAFHLDSVLLRDVDRRRGTGMHGVATPDLAGFGDEDPFKKSAHGVKSFNH